MTGMIRADVQSATHVELADGTVKKIASKWGIDENGHLAKPSAGGFGVVTDDGERVPMMAAKSYWQAGDRMTDISEDREHREVWFIYSPSNEPWGNLRIATFTKAINSPHLELVVIHNESDKRRIGVRVWNDIVQSEHWFKVRQIEVPSAADVMAASLKELQ